MNDSDYKAELEKLFVRFPSVQNVGFKGAYKPGLDNMERFCTLLGHPEKDVRWIHIAGTNGKGSVANMIASALAAKGLSVGLYTSPHILDFRERMRIIDGRKARTKAELIGKEEVQNFICSYREDFDRLSLSFFEITTGMAFKWFNDRKVDIAVLETGLGGRLDSTNVVTPLLSIITSIGLDHCSLLGNTRAEIAAEKAGIFKKGVPALIGSRDDETAPVFEQQAQSLEAPLHFADSADAPGWDRSGAMLAEMDLQGCYQRENLRTVLAALALIRINFDDDIAEAICRTAARMDFHGRWELIGRCPDMICDIGHNPPALKQNFAQLRSYLEQGRYRRLIIVYGVMADKDLDGILPLMPEEAQYILVAPDTPRAMPSAALYDHCRKYWEQCGRKPSSLIDAGKVANGLILAKARAAGNDDTLIYVGGSTFVVSEAISLNEEWE